DQLAWMKGIKVLRLNVHRQVPELTRARRVPPIGRLALVSTTLVRAVGGWAIKDRRAGGTQSRSGISRRIREAAEKLGPTYIKLCQIVSSGQGLFPEELVSEMIKCRDRVPAESFNVVRGVVEAELGGRLEATFATFDRTPIAAASIAQVHGATLLDGTPVVVKVQRPTIRELVHQDLEVMSTIAPLLVGRIPVSSLANPPALVELFAETICEELDFRLEAENMIDIATVFASLGQRGYVIPRPHPTLVTRRMLVMERFDGFNFDDVEGMQAAGIDTEEVIRVGMRGFTEGCMIWGIFHGDLHGGNLMVMPDGRIGLLDHGITARMTPLERSALLRLMMTGATGDVKGQLAAFRDLGALPPDAPLDEIIRDLGLDKAPVDPTTLDQQELVDEIQRIIKALLAYGARLPKILMLFVKNLVFLDGAIGQLAPNLDLIGEFANISTHMAITHGEQIASDLGVDPASLAADKEAMKASFGIVDPDMEVVTYAELQKRRDTIRRRLSKG
ncbi:MAG: AarF/ABC1/UbiB kinase family protein, partial [Actinobacteria bacterium]|nr:AarF/ABC1/UbiB kinase family protein [Actinomycetota bacterium]